MLLNWLIILIYKIMCKFNIWGIELVCKIFFAFFFIVFSSLCFSANDENDKILLEKIITSTYDYAKYGYDDNILTIERLEKVENDIEKLKALAVKYPNEPRIYYVIRDLYSSRGRLIGMKIHIEDRAKWFSLPIVQENTQGIRDNCYEAIRVHELGIGVRLEKQMILNCTVSSLMSRQFIDRAYKAIHKMLPDVIECKESDDPYDDCITQYKKDIVLKDYIGIQDEYIAYGLFDDAKRLNNEIAQVSDEGKAAAADGSIRIEEAQKNFNPSKYENDIDYALMQPGGTPKPITIKAADAIAENQKAIAEKEQAKLAASSISASSEAQSSVSSTPSAESVTAPPAENKNRLILIGAGVALLLLVGFIALRRRK